MEMNEENKKRLEWMFEELLYSPRQQQPKGFKKRFEALEKEYKPLREFLIKLGYKPDDRDQEGFPDVIKKRNELEKEYEQLYQDARKWFEETFFDILTSRFWNYVESLS